MDSKVTERWQPQNIERTFSDAVSLHMAGQMQDAETLYRQILEARPEHLGCLHNLGVIAHAMGSIDQAIELIKKAVALGPGYAEAHNNLGIILTKQDRMEEALASFERAVAANPNYAMAVYNLDFVRRKLGRMADAVSKDTQSLGLEAPSSAPGWLGLKDYAAQLRQQILDRTVEMQNGVLTFYDNYILNWFTFLENRPLTVSAGEVKTQAKETIQIQTVLDRLQCIFFEKRQGRYVAIDERRAVAETADAQKVFKPPYGDEIDELIINMSQGVDQCMHWKGMPIFKTVFDMSLYSMLIWDIKPKTIIELGSGTGASAIWMADLIKTYGLETQIYSLDVKKPNLEQEGVRFIQGDCNTIDRYFSTDMLAGLPHPWIVIEDAHANVLQVVGHFSDNMLAGDYMIVEDTRGPKEAEVLTWARLNKNKFKIDTKYTDFFGRNATCSPDSIFVHV